MRGAHHKALAALAGISCLMNMSSAFAHQADVDGNHTAHRIGYDPRTNQSTQYGAFEFRMGPYMPRVDSEFSGDTPFENVFGTKPSVTIGIEFDFQALRIPYVGTLGPGVGWHWFSTSGIAQFTNGNPGSAHENSLWIMPMYVVGVLRADVFMREWKIPLVPYIKGGFAFSMWQSRDAGKVSVAGGEKAQGFSTGLQYQLGLMLHLNPLAEQTAGEMDAATGVNNAYIFGEWWASDVDSFGTSMQTGTATWILGMALEF